MEARFAVDTDNQMAATPTIYKIGLAVIVDDALLLCRPYAYDDLIVPGGIKEGDESAIENLTREVREELGPSARLDGESLEYLGNFTDRAAGRSERTVEIELYSGTVAGSLVASSEIRELVWYEPQQKDSYKLSAIVERQIVPHLISIGLLSRTAWSR